MEKSKKIVFLQLEENSYGGSVAVNFTLAGELQKMGWDCSMAYLRALPQKGLPLPDGVKSYTAREGKKWSFVTGSDIKRALCDRKPFRAAALFFKRVGQAFLRDRDFAKIQLFLRQVDPDLILVSHYLLLEAIPEERRDATIFHAHTSFEAIMSVKAQARLLTRLNGSIRFLWLSEAICKKAEKAGFSPSFYLYNPLKFVTEASASRENRTLCALTRLSPEKRLCEMCEHVKSALDRVKGDWRFEIWGSGEEEEKIKLKLSELGDDRLSLPGRTDDPQSVLLSSALALNTSEFEGFSLSVIEAAECGVPTLSFRFGEACEEEILSGKTGVLVPQDDWRAWEDALVDLLENPERIHEMGANAKEFAKNFHPALVAERFLNLFLLLL